MKRCSKCREIKPFTAFHKQKCKKDGLRVHCKNCRSTYAKTVFQANKNKILAQNKQWYQNNTEHHYQLTKHNWTKHYKNNINFRIAKTLRSRLYVALKNNSQRSSAIKVLGCSIVELKEHLERQFQDQMSWDNYGQWHIDHVKPLSRFDLSNAEDLKKACHYSNLQPLWAKDNLVKGSTYER